MHIYSISDDIYGDRSHFRDDWEDSVADIVQSKFDFGYYSNGHQEEREGGGYLETKSEKIKRLLGEDEE